jgi:hypothetical protein
MYRFRAYTSVSTQQRLCGSTRTGHGAVPPPSSATLSPAHLYLPSSLPPCSSLPPLDSPPLTLSPLPPQHPSAAHQAQLQGTRLTRQVLPLVGATLGCAMFCRNCKVRASPVPCGLVAALARRRQAARLALGYQLGAAPVPGSSRTSRRSAQPLQHALRRSRCTTRCGA